MIVHSSEAGVLRQADGIELTAQGFDEVSLTLTVDLLQSAGTASLVVVGGEDTVLAVDDRGDFIPIFIEVADALLLDDLERCRGQ